VFEPGRCEGIRYPTAPVDRRYCFVLFIDHLATGSSIRAVSQSQDLDTISGSFKLQP